MIMVESAGLTDTGRIRRVNEDALLCDDRLRLYLVADGMGGHRAGAVASGIVIDSIRDDMEKLSEGTRYASAEPLDQGLSDAANRLLLSIYRANRKVNRISRDDESCRGMGSTVSAVCFTDDGLVVANVGDSPIWLAHNGQIETLSVPHTILAEQMARNPSAATLCGPGFRHMLTRAIGVEATVEVDVSEVQCFERDVIILGSDGLSNKVSPQEILDVVERREPCEACRVLVELANERGGEDNITVIVVRVKATHCGESSLGAWIRRVLRRES